MLDEIIAPEIKNDMFYALLHILASSEAVRSILEIGSSSGEGSTDAFVQAIRVRSDRDLVSLYCIEISKNRFAKLISMYSSDRFVKPYNLSSIAPDAFPSRDEVINFYHRIPSRLNQYSLESILEWHTQDIEYLNQNGMNINGINFIKNENKIQFFDLVLIDGSEFTGERDLHSVLGARLIALDDVMAFKCWNAYQYLLHNSSYQLMHCDLKTRNGFAIFERNF